MSEVSGTDSLLIALDLAIFAALLRRAGEAISAQAISVVWAGQVYCTRHMYRIDISERATYAGVLIFGLYLSAMWPC